MLGLALWCWDLPHPGLLAKEKEKPFAVSLKIRATGFAGRPVEYQKA